MKYLIHNDIHYLLNKGKKLFLSIICCILIGNILSINGEAPLFDILTRSMGTNISLENFDVIPFIMYTINIAFFLYLIVRIYVKDLNDNLENMFLRVNPSKFIINKNICFIVFSILIKTIQYLISIIIINKAISFEVIRVFISDVIYILVIQFAFLLFYLFYILMKKNIICLVVPTVILMLVIPKSIYSIFSYSIYYVIGLLVILILIYLIFNKKCKLLLENV